MNFRHLNFSKSQFDSLPGRGISNWGKYTFYLLILPLVIISCKSGDDRADAYGNFEADSYYISAEVNGKISSFNVDEGDIIKKGSTIATIDSMQLYFQKNQLIARVEALKSKLQDVPVQLASLQEREQILLREVNRVKSLFADSAATQKQVDDLTGELKVVQKQLAATKSQLSTANRGLLSEIEPVQWQIRQIEDQLAKTTVKAPADGTILETFKEPGELAFPGQPLAKIADLSTMTLRGYVSGNQLSSLKIGQEVNVSVDSESDEMKSFKGKVSWIASEAEFTPKVIQTKEERVNMVYAVKFAVKNDGTLKIGMPGEVLF